MIHARTPVRSELIGGATTFLAMAYIIVVNPAILEAAGLPIEASTVATILVAAVGSILMGVYANLPIAVAPYMGENAFLAFGLAAFGITWQERLGAVFVSGFFFLLLTWIGWRGRLAQSISPSLKHSFAAGIGLFLAFIGMVETGIVERAEAVPVKIGDLRNPEVLLAVAGFFIMAVLFLRNVRGAILIGILATAAGGIALGFGRIPERWFAIPFHGEYSLAPIAFQLDVAGVLKLSFLPILLTLVLMSFLDTLGTLMGVGAAAGMIDERGEVARIERPMTVDAVACMLSGVVGTSTSGAYIESAVGIREGARSGLAAITTGLLFAMALFFIPAVEPLQRLKFAYGPALIMVGVLMLESIARIDFRDPTELLPAFVTIAMMVFTYSIANGLVAGLAMAPLLKALAGRWREIRAGSVVLAVLCIAYFIWGLPH